jgi:hypothetical protein
LSETILLPVTSWCLFASRQITSKRKLVTKILTHARHYFVVRVLSEHSSPVASRLAQLGSVVRSKTLGVFGHVQPALEPANSQVLTAQSPQGKDFQSGRSMEVVETPLDVDQTRTRELKLLKGDPNALNHDEAQPSIALIKENDGPRSLLQQERSMGDIRK